MRLSISEHKLPIGVTTVGLIVATGLAIAPVLMADSSTDILADKNAKDIQSLTSQLQQQAEDLNQQLASQSSGVSGQVKNLDAQVVILNKAVKNIFNKSQAQSKATEVALNELSSGPRLVNIEKAVSNLNRKHNSMSTKLESSLSQSNDRTDVRLQNLEKAVKRMHQRQQRTGSMQLTEQTTTSQVQDSKTEQRLASIEREYRSMFGRVASLENTVRLLSSADNNPVPSSAMSSTESENTSGSESNSQIAELELLVSQLLQRQQRNSTTQSSERNFSTSNTDRGSSNRIKRLERVIARMERRLNSIESSGNNQDDMVEQLYEIQDYIDQVLDQINR